MNNLQDELAWLNHRLDNKLEEWRKLHRLHGRFNAFLMYCLLIISIVFLFRCSNLCKDDNALYVFVISVATVGSMLSFGVLSWMLYGRLLTMGHKSKGGIEHSHLDIPRIAEGTFLKECRREFTNLLRIERSFPFSDDVKRCIVKCQMVRQLQSKLKGVKNQLIEIKNQLAEVEKQLTEVEKQATKVLKQLTEVEKQVTKVENQLIEVENQLKKSGGKPQKNSTEAV
jgi:hypothetical protein